MRGAREETVVDQDIETYPWNHIRTLQANPRKYSGHKAGTPGEWWAQCAVDIHGNITSTPHRERGEVEPDVAGGHGFRRRAVIEQRMHDTAFKRIVTNPPCAPRRTRTSVRWAGGHGGCGSWIGGEYQSVYRRRRVKRNAKP
jgi:hypothetical protein